MNRFAIPFLVLSLLTAGAAVAADLSDLYVVPIAGHTHGAFGTAWRSDLVLHNLQAEPITVEMALIESGRPAAADAIAIPFGVEPLLHLGPGETRVISDVLGQQRRDITGALIVGASLPFVLTSRTYAEGTLGQTVPPIAITSGADASSEVAILAGLAENERQRANVGLVLAASRAPFLAEIELVSASGSSLGSQLVALDTEGFAHHQFAAATIASEGVTALVRIVEGEGLVVPYASMIDNASAEAMFVSAAPATGGGAAAARAMLARSVMVSECGGTATAFPDCASTRKAVALPPHSESFTPPGRNAGGTP
jgi:hypothetical protein